ncbi:hypothetical protein FOA52_016173 [Chlamydomonas sp. UWO 241]|nr:hypothetical protein FOA52_016173 [Chlamydomonas sp. UWO 241]
MSSTRSLGQACTCRQRTQVAHAAAPREVSVHEAAAAREGGKVRDARGEARVKVRLRTLSRGVKYVSGSVE